MPGNESVLDKIYKDLKAKRIVLTRDEYAKAIGISRATLFRLRDEPHNISKELISKARSLSETNIDSNETANEPGIDYIKRIKKTSVFTDKGSNEWEEISRLHEKVINLQASVNVILLTLENLAGDVKGISVGLISQQMRQAIKMESDRLFDELSGRGE